MTIEPPAPPDDSDSDTPDPSAIRFGDFHSVTKNLTVQRQKGMQAIINRIRLLTEGK